MKKELVIFETLDKEISLSVEILKNTVWLTQNQMAELFKTTKQNISLHANNCFKEGELDKNQCQGILDNCGRWKKLQNKAI